MIRNKSLHNYSHVSPAAPAPPTRGNTTNSNFFPRQYLALMYLHFT